MEILAWFSKQAAAASGVVMAILGAGSLVTLALAWWQNAKATKASKVRVATNLRQWADKVHGLVCEARTFVDSDGCGGEQHTAFPPLAMDHMADLEPRIAERLFDLVHQCDAANCVVAATLQYEDADEALDEFLALGAKLYCAAVDLYKELSSSVGWARDAFSEDEKLSMMREQEAAAERKETQRRAAAASWN